MLEKQMFWLNRIIFILGILCLVSALFARSIEADTISMITVAAPGVAIFALGWSEINHVKEREYMRSIIKTILAKLEASKDEPEERG